MRLKLAGVDRSRGSGLLCPWRGRDFGPHPCAGGFGESQAGVIGENEWFRLGRTTIAHTQSACCAATPEISRQIGAGILEHFRLTFDYPHRRLILESPAGSDESRSPREP